MARVETAVPVEPVPVGQDLQVVVSPGAGSAFYRLRLDGGPGSFMGATRRRAAEPVNLRPPDAPP